jgi:hypothetical protein
LSTRARMPCCESRSTRRTASGMFAAVRMRFRLVRA